MIEEEHDSAAAKGPCESRNRRADKTQRTGKSQRLRKTSCRARKTRRALKVRSIAKARQLPLGFRQHGGKRRGSGRKPTGQFGKGAGVPHRPRRYLDPRHPVHVTLRFVSKLPNLRSRKCFSVLRQAFFDAKERGLRLVHFSVQRRHIHLIVEAEGARALSKGMQGLCIRIAKNLNKRLNRKGKVFADRYHAHYLQTATETFFALQYVLLNSRRHDAQRGILHEELWIDPCSSGPYFSGWKGVRHKALRDPDKPVAHAWTFLLREGWRVHGLIEVDKIPGAEGRAGGCVRTRRV
jgi:hypothetical protein